MGEGNRGKGVEPPIHIFGYATASCFSLTKTLHVSRRED